MIASIPYKTGTITHHWAEQPRWVGIAERFDAAAPSSPMTALVPVILCGGTGTRLWPLSRAT
ncbi:sugar phosphate nucleotidyltransferase, partial [Vulcanococcus sp. Clear-D1]|uniref:sugar phosphate nucleotidyltransferase n=1 Tax=Vulcanococcus sp. Clear-D1 TaxID=2766970 RepID=UPI0025F9BA51